MQYVFFGMLLYSVNMHSLYDLPVTGKRVFLRADLNVPMQAGKITHDGRIQAIRPTLDYLLSQKARIILVSHLGRPTVGQAQPEFSLKPIADYLKQVLHYPVRFQEHGFDPNVPELTPGEIYLYENVRFLAGEETNDPKLAQQFAQLCDIFVMDAFATAHRAHASTVGIAQYAPISCAGPLLCQEINALHQAFKNPNPPVIAIIGGAKVATKLPILKSLLPQVDYILTGSGFAPELESFDPKLILPIDFIHDPQSGKIMDIGPRTQKLYSTFITTAKTIIWNGPLGKFEVEPFAAGTKAIAECIAQSSAYSLVGGGETLAALDQYQLTSQISYCSTGGGAFLEYLEGKPLPGIAVL
jgi:phosphoglycerate kinase